MKPAELRRRLRTLRALVLDVDGVQTDGGLYYGPSGQTFKRFDVKDGLGLRRIQHAGLTVAFISGETSPATRRRAEKLDVRHLYLGTRDKARSLGQFLAASRIPAHQMAFVGDDVTDLPAMAAAGVAIAVEDAVDRVREAADWVTRRPGGRGAVREVCEAILAARA
jgi:3-deoxy-D-manno-octulosonate 8-phosphate phosphatase (KDO 8-P phosphatase)